MGPLVIGLAGLALGLALMGASLWPTRMSICRRSTVMSIGGAAAMVGLYFLAATRVPQTADNKDSWICIVPIAVGVAVVARFALAARLLRVRDVYRGRLTAAGSRDFVTELAKRYLDLD